MRHGFLLIDKRAGPSSHHAVAEVRRRLSERDIGHLGTLDPGATGLLVLAVGNKALKVVEFFKNLHKEYEATIRFGAVSSTFDADGTIDPVQTKPGWVEPDEITMRNTITDRFIGMLDQVPPAHSAIHIAGNRAYELARKGIDVQMPSRKVEVTACDMLSFTYPVLKLRVACSSGTYIRSLAHDLGQVLRSGAYLEALRRTKVGMWSVANAVKADEASWTDIVPLKDVMKNFPAIEITEEEKKEIGFGRRINREIKPDTIAWHDGLPVAVLVPAKDGTKMAQPRKVF